jgi:Predicted permeases
MFGIPVSELIILFFALLAAGALTGMLAGLFGVGGGSIIVPVLYELFRILAVPEDVRMPLSVGTSLAIIIPTSIRSFRTHYSKGAVDMDFLKQWAVPVVVGVVVGSFIARFAPAYIFKVVFIIVAGFSSIRMMMGLDFRARSEGMPGKGTMITTGGIIGVCSSLMGVGGGLLSNLFMSYFHRPIHRAVATSSGVGIFVSIPGAIGFIMAGWSKAAEYPDVAVLQFPISIGYVSLLGMALLIPTSTLFAPMGATLAHRLSKRTLQLSFGLFLFLISIRYIISLLP